MSELSKATRDKLIKVRAEYDATVMKESWELEDFYNLAVNGHRGMKSLTDHQLVDEFLDTFTDGGRINLDDEDLDPKIRELCRTALAELAIHEALQPKGA